ncbi:MULTISPECIES: hypothetical protein [Methylobacterium]|uniref:hypothetical protein n=1 Tax=Methylobacterium TaxID=407 RepID=UPI0013E9ACD4|nr:hypothetical protein [Methylobacterium sp. DB0501]NGM32920.1 hypothetical protein [Methylobacterium sp. DB0501]
MTISLDMDQHRSDLIMPDACRNRIYSHVFAAKYISILDLIDAAIDLGRRRHGCPVRGPERVQPR